MLRIFSKNLKRLCSKLRWPLRRRRCKSRVVVKKYKKSSSKSNLDPIPNGSATVHPNGPSIAPKSGKPIRIATFNAALFSMAAVDDDYTKEKQQIDFKLRSRSAIDRPKGILKQSPLHPNSVNGSNSENLPTKEKFAKSRLRVSINLPDNEISLSRSGRIKFNEDEKEEEGTATSTSSSSSSIIKNRILKGKTPLRSASSLGLKSENGVGENGYRSGRTVVEVLRELDADILGLQDVKAEEEKEMKPLSDLASALGMNYVFAESWAPEYGNAILSKWPIKKWRVQKIFDDSDIRNVLRATIDIPHVGEVNFQCTLLDHLDENWRMKQIDAIIESNEGPHILAGGLNSFDETDYSLERWTDIVKYYEDMGKPTPKAEVMRFLKSKQYTDAKDFAGECESVVMIAKGQSVQGTCKYGTRVDYILASSDSPYKFVPGSYSVFSSKGTSDHHIVKVDVTKIESSVEEYVDRKPRQRKQRIVKITNSSSSKGLWKTDRGR